MHGGRPLGRRLQDNELFLVLKLWDDLPAILLQLKERVSDVV